MKSVTFHCRGTSNGEETGDDFVIVKATSAAFHGLGRVTDNSGKNKGALYAAGDIISGVITEKDTEKVRIRRYNDSFMDLPAGGVQGNMGEEVSFRVIDKKGDRLVLKQIDQSKEKYQKQTIKSFSVNSLKELMEKSGFSRDEGIQGYRERDIELKKQQAAAEAKIRRKMGRIAMGAGNEAVRELLSAGINMNKISLPMLASLMGEMENNPYIEKSLAMGGAVERLKGLRDFTDGETAAFLKEGKPMSLDNVEAAMGRACPPVKNMEDRLFEEIKPDVERLFREEGIENSRENIELARFLVSNGIELTKENLDNAAFLKNLASRIDKGVFISNAAEKLREGLSPGEGLLTGEAPALEEGERLSHRLQMAEMRFKSALEAFAERGVGFDYESLKIQVEHLRDLRREYYARTLRQAGCPDSESNISLMAGVGEKLGRLPYLTSYSYRAAVLKEIDFTIDSLTRFTHAGEYESFAAVPNGKYGDSFLKASEGLEGFLEDMGMEANKINLKAAAIASQSGLELSPENITGLREIYEKVEAVYKSLHPMIVADMIKEGFNPAEKDIDEVLAYIGRYEDLYGNNGGDRLVRHIMEMDRNPDFPPEDRQAITAVYRMLNIIRKSGGAIGASQKAGYKNTLGNLLNAAENFSLMKKGGAHHFDVGDGDVETGKDSGIRRALQEGFTGEDFHAQSVVSGLIAEASPRKLSWLMNQNRDYRNLSPEKALEILQDREDGGDEVYKHAIREGERTLDALGDIPLRTIRLAEEMGITLRIGDIIAFRSIIRNLDRDGKTDLDEDDWEEMIEKDGIEGILAKDEAGAAALAAKLKERINAQDDPEKVVEMQRLAPSLEVKGALSKAGLKSGIIRFNGRPAEAEVYVINQKKEGEDLTMFVALRTDMGNISAKIELAGHTANVAVGCDDSRGLEQLMKNKAVLADIIKEAGFSGEIAFLEAERPGIYKEILKGASWTADPAPAQDMNLEGRLEVVV